MARSPRNSFLIPGVSRLSKAASYKAKLLWKRKKTAAPKVEKPIAAEVKPRFYPAEDISLPKDSRKTVKAPKIRASITPGTVLILLSGRFAGKHVVFLKQLESGLLLVSGPHKVNGVPLRRVNQAYVIATSTKIDVNAVKIPAHINDSYFVKENVAKKSATEEQLFKDYSKKTTVIPERAADQKALDKQLLPIIKKTPLLKNYLQSTFALANGQYPHTLKF